MNFFLLILTIAILLFSLLKMHTIEEKNYKSISQEIKHYIYLLMWGLPVVVTLLFIPYQMWILTGKSSDWDGVYIGMGTAIITILSSFIIYYRLKVKLN